MSGDNAPSVHDVNLATLNRIDHDFAHHAPDAERIRVHERIRVLHRDLARELVALVPPGRERSLALTHLEESMFYANAGVARYTTPD